MIHSQVIEINQKYSILQYLVFFFGGGEGLHSVSWSVDNNLLFFVREWDNFCLGFT